MTSSSNDSIVVEGSTSDLTIDKTADGTPSSTKIIKYCGHPFDYFDECNCSLTGRWSEITGGGSVRSNLEVRADKQDCGLVIDLIKTTILPNSEWLTSSINLTLASDIEYFFGEVASFVLLSGTDEEKLKLKNCARQIYRMFCDGEI